MKKRHRLICSVFMMSALIAQTTYATGVPVVNLLEQAAQNIMNEKIQKGVNVAEDSQKELLSANQFNARNSESLKSFDWDAAQSNVDALTSTLDDTDAKTDSYHNLDYYRNCIKNKSCSQSDLSVLEKNANDALLKSVDEHKRLLDDDAKNLEKIKSHAEGAGGQLQAMQAQNEFANSQASQLMQIRSLLIAREKAEATRAATEANNRAKLEAMDEHLKSGELHKTQNPKHW